MPKKPSWLGAIEFNCPYNHIIPQRKDKTTATYRQVYHDLDFRMNYQALHAMLINIVPIMGRLHQVQLHQQSAPFTSMIIHVANFIMPKAQSNKIGTR